MNIADFGRYIRGISDVTTRTAAYQWYAQHIDMMEVGMDTFVSTYQAYEKASFIKSLNPTMKVFGYDYDQTMCQHTVCTYTNPANTNQNNLPEDQYLHFSEDTQLQFTALDGTVLPTVTVPGCPEPDAVSASCRAQVFIWNDSRWLPNLKNAAWQAWYADHLLAEMEYDRFNIRNSTDGLFLDEHGIGFSITMSIGASTKILSGGGIREYNGLVPHDYHTGTYDTLDQQYTTDVNAWLTYLRGRLSAAGKFAHINTAEYFTDPHAYSQNLAIGGAMTEHLHRADDWTQGSAQYQTFINQVAQMVGDGGSIDLAGTWCYNGPANFTAGNYPSSTERFRMWNLAGYYLVKEPVGSAGIVWFDPNLCIDPDGPNPLSFEDEWLNAYQVDVGQPVDTATVIQSGSRACTPQGYKIFARQYTNAYVLVRPRDDWNCQTYDDTTAVTVPLSEPMVMLEPDGTTSAPMNSVSIRNAEAVILFPAPDTTPPATITDLRVQ